jgi:hypothetical protein
MAEVVFRAFAVEFYFGLNEAEREREWNEMERNDMEWNGFLGAFFLSGLSLYVDSLSPCFRPFAGFRCCSLT